MCLAQNEHFLTTFVVPAIGSPLEKMAQALSMLVK